MTTGRINQVYTKSPFSVTGTESMHTSPRQLETIFRPPSSRRRLPNDSRPRRAPTNSPQPGNRVSKDHPCPQEAGSNQIHPRRKKSFKVPENKARKSKFASRGGPRHRTGGHDVKRSGSTAPLHQKATRTTVRPNSGAKWKPPRPHTHIRKTRGITIIIFKTTRVDFSLVGSGLAGPFWKSSGGKTHPSTAAPPYLRDFPF